jgi:LysR family hydrogen peroxide-inducible transcriptional activator
MSLAPHPFTLRQLQYALAVAEELSFRRAAERCRVAQPSLSAQIAQLEGALDVQLFERTQRKVLVTSAGRALLERARRVVLDADDLLEASRRAGDPLAGTIRIGVIPTLAPYLLPTVSPALHAKFPRLTLAWREDRTAELLAALEAGALDAALLALEAELGEVEHEVLARDPFVLALPAAHPLARSTGPVETQAMRGADVLLLDDGHCFRDQALEVCTSARAREGELRATSLTTLVQMVAGGAGVTLLPSIAVATEASRASLCVRPLASPNACRTIALVWRKRSPLAPALRAIAQVARASYPEPAHVRPRNVKRERRSPSNPRARS